ncbi:DUF4190 domain-containing protein [Aquibacillus sediminis]|uniref:DUF4190 domain-containing protein n=1 Tax=Aquibacillus sediminis TaxID=2574734 RepID=UPI001108194A|nr:DUF4190 domain-containing protein [Aquibacillus sediminis]
MDESYRNERNEEVEEAPKFGEDVEPNEITGNQAGAQRPIIEDEELYSLDEAYKRDEEVAQELTATDFNRPMETDEQETEMKTEVNTGMGWLALVLAALSFFVMPVILGAAAVIFGFISKRRGADTLGNTAIVIGAISIIVSLFIAPFV